MLKAGALDEELVDVALDVDVLLARQRLERFRQIEQALVKRRARRGERQPVGPHIGKLCAGRALQHAGELGVGLRVVGIDRKYRIPISGVPAEIVDVDADDGLVRIDGRQTHDIRRAAQAVDELDRALAVDLHRLVADAGVGQARQGQIARALGADSRQLFKVGRDQLNDVFIGHELVCLAGRGALLAKRIDPGRERLEIGGVRNVPGRALLA